MRYLILTLIITGLSLLKTPMVLAQDIAGSSARLQYLSLAYKTNNSSQNLYRLKKTMKQVLNKYNSPLVEEVDNFIYVCVKYKLDCYLLPSIAGLESTFGRFIYPNSFNPFGWGGGYIMFSSWKEGIETVAAGLRKNYIDRGAENLWSIGRIYSESPTWALRVQHFINEFKAEEEKLPLFLDENTVEL